MVLVFFASRWRLFLVPGLVLLRTVEEVFITFLPLVQPRVFISHSFLPRVGEFRFAGAGLSNSSLLSLASGCFKFCCRTPAGFVFRSRSRRWHVLGFFLSIGVRLHFSVRRGVRRFCDCGWFWRMPGFGPIRIPRTRLRGDPGSCRF